MISTYDFRLAARKAIKPVMQILIVIALVAALPGLLSDTILTLSGADPSVLATEISTMKDASAAQHALDAFVADKGGVYLAATLLTAILTPALIPGLYHALLCALRKQPVDMSMAWPGAQRFWKGLGTSLLSTLFLLLWSLPGSLVMTAGLTLLLMQQEAGLYVALAGMALMMIVMIRKAYAYCMAPYIIADAPDTGVRAAIRRSKEGMNGRRMYLFALEFSFIGWSFLVSMVQTVLMVMFGGVIGMTVGMFISLFLTVYQNGAVAAFYDAYFVKGVEAARHDAAQAEDEVEILTDEEQK